MTARAAASLVTVDGADASGIDIQFPETFNVSGVILDSGDSPVSEISLSPCEVSTQACSFATSAGTGLFTIPTLVAGDYTIEQSDPAHVYKRGYYGGQGVFVATSGDATTISVGPDVTGLELLAVERGTVTLKGPGVNVVLDDGLGNTPVSLTFDQVTSEGLTTLFVAEDGEPLPSGLRLGDPPIYYDIVSSATFEENVTICISYAGVTFLDENAVRLYHFDEGTSTWEDVTDLPVDTVNDIACGTTDSLSPFLIVEPAASFGGFFGPKPAPQLNEGKAGTRIGVKFSFGDDAGLDIFADDSPYSTQINCATGEPTGAPLVARLCLKYNQQTGLYTFSWETSKTWRKTCRALTLVFTNGSTAEVWYRF